MEDLKYTKILRISTLGENNVLENSIFISLRDLSLSNRRRLPHICAVVSVN